MNTASAKFGRGGVAEMRFARPDPAQSQAVLREVGAHLTVILSLLEAG
jgi:hypothetical protein